MFLGVPLLDKKTFYRIQYIHVIQGVNMIKTKEDLERLGFNRLYQILVDYLFLEEKNGKVGRSYRPNKIEVLSNHGLTEKELNFIVNNRVFKESEDTSLHLTAQNKPCPSYKMYDHYSCAWMRANNHSLEDIEYQLKIGYASVRRMCRGQLK